MVHYEIPKLCVKCGTAQSLMLKEYAFSFRTFWSYLGDFAGVSYELEYKMNIYFCFDCANRLDNAKIRSKMTLIAGFFLSCAVLILGIAMTDGQADYTLPGLIMAFLIIPASIIASGYIAAAPHPKVIKIDRRTLIIDIPGYGATSLLPRPASKVVF